MRFLIGLILPFLLIRCASQTSPNGGPQDKEPPKLLSSNPTNNQRNFKEEQIELTFDEYIKLKNPAEEIMISPTVGKETKFVVKKNKLVIVPKKTLAENTTYNISFRDAVQDMNEGNPTPNLRLAFSTGEEIDSLSVSGNVYQLFKEEAPDKITVALYQADTFNIFNHQPTYFTRTDKNGKFTITNLKAGLYNIYAFDDKSKNLKVESKTERFGFITKTFNTVDKVDTLKIPLMQVDARPIKITSIRNTKRTSSVRINKPIDSVRITSDYSRYFIQSFGDQQNEIVFYGILKEPPPEDSLKINLTLIDSVKNMLDTTVYIKSADVKTVKETFKINYLPTTFHYPTKTATLTANFNKPIASMNFDSIYFQLDSTNFRAITQKDISIDTFRHKLTLSAALQLIPSPKDGSPLNPILVLGKGVFVSIEQDSSKAKTETIKVEKEDQLGTMAVEVSTKEKHYFLQLLSSRGDVVETRINPTKHTFANLAPQEYKIRIVVDRNKNHKWDAGNFQKRIEPERIFYYQSIDKKTSIPVRANWEVGPLLIKF